jgi:hypothetical protein
VFEFVIVKLNEVEPPCKILVCPNNSPIDGWLSTVKLADAAVPLPSLVELNALVVLVYEPAVAAVTLILKMHCDPAATVPPERLIEPLPAIAVIVPPPHDPVRPFGVATTRPDGRVSVNARPVAPVELSVFVTVKISWLVPPGAMVEGLNKIPSVGGEVTVKVALAAVPATSV